MTDTTAHLHIPLRQRGREYLPLAASLGLLLLCVPRHAGFMVVFAVPFLATWCIYSAVVAVRWPARRRTQAVKGIVLAAVLAAIGVAHWHYARDARAHAQAVADAMLVFERREGRFPERMGDLGVDEAQARRQWRLSYRLVSGRPHLFYATTFTMFETFDFDFAARTWIYHPD